VFLSSGTKPAISNVVEAFTGTVPGIYELWQQTSYWNYNPNDATIIYYWTSYNDPDPTDPVFHWWDFTYQLNTIYVILPRSVINSFGIPSLKDIIDNAKASGVVAYLGYLVDETFSDGHDDNWEPLTDVKGETSVPADWTVTSEIYTYTSTGAHPSGMSVVDDVHHEGSNDWSDYMVTSYCKNVTAVDSNNTIVGVTTRWDEDTDEFYFFGICTNNNNWYIYKYEDGPTWQLITNDSQDADGNSVTFDKDTNYHFRVVMNGSGAKFFIDNVLMYSSTTGFDEITNGRPGFAAITASSTAIIGKFDDMTVVV